MLKNRLATPVSLAWNEEMTLDELLHAARRRLERGPYLRPVPPPANATAKIAIETLPLAIDRQRGTAKLVLAGLARLVTASTRTDSRLPVPPRALVHVLEPSFLRRGRAIPPQA